MEALLVEEIPTGEKWQYEPKWDGFRGVLENDGGELALWSRNGRPLLRYFPELRPLGDLLPPHSAVDGEIVIERDGKLDFDAMQMRLHPAESRIRKLAAETPSTYIAFDVLLWNGEAIHRKPRSCSSTPVTVCEWLRSRLSASRRMAASVRIRRRCWRGSIRTPSWRLFGVARRW
jgi:ATP-dependent DNA ligase